MKDIKELRVQTAAIDVLYVEDDLKLLNNGATLFRKLFHNVYTATEGETALGLFKIHYPDLVITDLSMPKMNGLDLSKEIKKLSPKTKIIVISAFDDKESLMRCIELDIFKFLKKPVQLSQLLEAISLALKERKDEQNRELLKAQQDKLLNNQNIMTLILHKNKPIKANKLFLEFFNLKSIEEFQTKHNDLGSLFLKKEGFLYNENGVSWLDKIQVSKQNIFNVEMKDSSDSVNHFLLKHKLMPEHDSYTIITLDNITQLNLNNPHNTETNTKENEQNPYLINILTVLKENGAKVQLHNYYKGLSITNYGVITEIDKDHIVFKTNPMQLKAIKNEKQAIIVSDTLLNPIFCTDISKIEFTKQFVEFKTFSFSATSPISRRNVRVSPDNNYKVTLSINDHPYQGDISIKDLSVDAIKLKVDTLPAGLHNKNSKIYISITLYSNTDPIQLGTVAKYIREDEHDDSYSIVFLVDFDTAQKSSIIKYIAKRQMALIREFKGL